VLCVSYHHPETQDVCVCVCVCVQEVINILINKIIYYSMYVAMVVSGGGVSTACTILKLNFSWGRMNVGYGHVCLKLYVVDEIKNGTFIFLGLFTVDSVMLLGKLNMHLLVLFS